MLSDWTLLKPEPRHAIVPQLLIKFEIGLSNYKLLLTDLTHIWSESLDRKQIIQRAFSIDTSIDPSEDSGQLRLFLQSLGNALRQRKGTSVTILRSEHGQHFKLQTSTDLPGNLEPLQWCFQLVPASPFAMTNTVIVPVLHQQSIARIEKVSLIRQVKARDYVIGKLVERMQTDGLDLSRVFPGTASSKVGTGTNARKVIGKSIKGLTDFEQEEWQRTVFQDEKRPNMLMDLLSQLFNDSTEASSNVQAPDALDFGDWWKQLRGEDSQFKLADDSTSIRSEGGGSQGDDFQTQPTPPKDQERDQPPKESKARRDHVEGGMLLKQQSQDTDSTTDDTDDESSLSQHKKSLSMSDGRGKSTHSPESHRNKISDSKEQLIDRHNGVMNSPDRPTAARPKDEASSDSEDSMQLDHNRPPSNIATGTLVSGHYDLDKPKPKLGRIGGVGKIGMASTSQKLSNTPTTALSHKSFHGIDATHAKNDLRASTPPTISAKNHKQPALPPKAPLSPEETEQERANRKREQLKREIENKRQLGAKKKRKF